MSALPHIQKEFRNLIKDPPAGFRVELKDNSFFTWTVWFTGPEGTPYAGGQYKASMTFPKEFPMEPPTFRVLSSFWHPNVYPDGRVCISILHPPGVDEMNSEETAMMRWTPVQTIRSVLLSIVSLWSDPDPKDAGAPANVDALVQYRNNRAEFDAKCRQLAAKSLTELPPDFEAPSMEERVEVTKAPGSTFDYLASDDEMEDDEDDFDNFSATPAPVAAAGVADPAKKYSEELQQLRAMGVGEGKSDEELLELLTKYRGELASVIGDLC
ncbi:ubiquitin-conjugating enzyme protein [Lotmaria passim]